MSTDRTFVIVLVVLAATCAIVLFVYNTGAR